MTEFGSALDLYFGGDMEASLALGGQVAGRIDAVRPVARDHRVDGHRVPRLRRCARTVRRDLTGRADGAIAAGAGGSRARTAGRPTSGAGVRSRTGAARDAGDAALLPVSGAPAAREQHGTTPTPSCSPADGAAVRCGSVASRRGPRRDQAGSVTGSAARGDDVSGAGGSAAPSTGAPPTDHIHTVTMHSTVAPAMCSPTTSGGMSLKYWT